ncbi:DNA-binding protein [Brochothrix campestris]|uniref:DNA-binding protein n=1 Tax=Brochothrix campestris TaxID=2757 RepID=UPI0038CF2D18
MVRKKWKRNELLEILDNEFLSTQEVLDTLQITKQALYSLVLRNKIEQVRKGSVKLYFRSDIEKRLIEQEALRKKYRPYDFKESSKEKV